MKINWKAITAFLGAAVTGLGAAVLGSKNSPAEPMKPPEPPAFKGIDDEIDRKIEEQKDEPR